MSNIDVRSEFVEYGKKMKIVGIMTILVIIPYVGSFLSFIGFSLFLWWWWKIGKTTEVYVYITFLFLADVFLFAGSLHARILRFINPQESLNLVDSSLWAARTYLHGIIVFLIIFRMARRVHRAVNYENKKKKNRREYPPPVNHEPF